MRRLILNPCKNHPCYFWRYVYYVSHFYSYLTFLNHNDSYIFINQPVFCSESYLVPSALFYNPALLHGLFKFSLVWLALDFEFKFVIVSHWSREHWIYSAVKAISVSRAMTHEATLCPPLLLVHDLLIQGSLK